MQRAKRPRQDPVSCQLCRKKKLKCDRQQPCSNCRARGVSCEHAIGQSSRRKETPPESAGNAAILARLQRLEDIVLRAEETESASNSTIYQSPTTVAAHEHGEAEAHQAELSTLEHVGTQGYPNVGYMNGK